MSKKVLSYCIVLYCIVLYCIVLYRMAIHHEKNINSICIPIIEHHIKKEFIYYVFERFLGKNIIERIDIITKKDKRGHSFKRGFIHLKHWNNNSHHKHIQDILIKNGCIHLVYDTNFNYWKCFISKSAKPKF